MAEEKLSGYNLDHNSPVPLYYQLKEIIHDCIEKEIYQVGDRLPSEREFSEKFGINRLTVRQALNELVREGVLSKKRGIGTFVAPPKFEQGLLKLTGFSEDMQKRGFKPSARLISMEIINPSLRVVRGLELSPEDKVVRLERLRLAEGRPMALEVSHLPAGRFEGLLKKKKELEQGSLYNLLVEEFGVSLVKARETLEAGYARERDAELLKIRQNAPVLLRERITYDESEKPVEFVRSFYRGDSYKFHIELKGENF